MRQRLEGSSRCAPPSVPSASASATATASHRPMHRTKCIFRGGGLLEALLTLAMQGLDHISTAVVPVLATKPLEPLLQPDTKGAYDVNADVDMAHWPVRGSRKQRRSMTVQPKGVGTQKRKKNAITDHHCRAPGLGEKWAHKMLIFIRLLTL